jgi:DNA primase
VVVEGYTDVLACHAKGVDNVVATLGTSLTDEHVKKLRGLADRVILLRDMDGAGQLSAEHSVTTLINGGMDTVKVASLDCDRCKDADDYLKARGPHDLRAVLAAAVQPFDYRLASEQANTRHDTAPERKARIIRTMVKWICSIKDEILKVQYRRALAERMNVPETVLFAYTGKAPQGISAKRAAARTQNSPRIIAEHEILRWLLHRPEHLGLANGALNVEAFGGPPERALALGIRAVVDDAIFDALPDNKYDFMRLVLAKLAGQSEAMELCMGLSEENPLGVMGQEVMMLSMMASLDRERIFNELADCEAESEAARKAKDPAAEARAAARRSAVREQLLARVKERQPKKS